MTLRVVTPIRLTSDKKSLYLYYNYYEMLKKRDIELIIATPSSFETYHQLCTMCDGLFLSGGLDIDPKFYNQDLHPTTKLEEAHLEQMEFSLISLFAKHNKPILGVCRGIQTINVFFNGTLHQDIPSIPNKTFLNHQQSIEETYAHKVTIQPNTTLSKFMNPECYVNSYHHQNIALLAPGFTTNAISEDGLIEGIEKDKILAVQWHPEKVNDREQEQILDAWLSLF